MTLTLGHDGSSGDAVRYLLEPRVQVQHLSRSRLHGLVSLQINPHFLVSLEGANLGVFATFKERSHADEADIVIPHDGILVIVSGYLEIILEDCIRVNK